MNQTDGLLTPGNVMAYFVTVIGDPRVCKDGHIIPQDMCKDKQLEELINKESKLVVIGAPEFTLRSYPNPHGADVLSLICLQRFYINLELYANNTKSKELMNPIIAIGCGSDGASNKEAIDLLAKLSFNLDGVKSDTSFMIRGKNYGQKSDKGRLIFLCCDSELKISMIKRSQGNGLPDNMLPNTKEGYQLTKGDIRDVANLYVLLKNNYPIQH
ncbi:hypothetical protein HYU07_06855 [Candidatus Woesearchaeota archaeon]|nr:hypothetical protein [Candidatus Woesearchaeota archaeon]